MLKQVLFWIVGIIAQFHGRILQLNNSFEANLNDKQLHFIVIGLLGMGLYLLVHPIFLALARRGHVSAISWLYTFTVIVVITFAIEIGQHVTGTGSMEFADITFGIAGFLLLYLFYALVRAILQLIRKMLQ